LPIKIGTPMLNRRDFLTYLASCGVCFSFPSLLNASSFKGKTLVLVELKVGNDGLNTPIPYVDPLYGELRPKLGIKSDKVLKIDNNFWSAPIHERHDGFVR